MNEQLKKLTERLERIENLLEQLIVRTKETDVGGNNNKPLSLKQAADYLHLSVSRMYSLIYQKKLNPVQRKRNSKLLFYVSELNRYLSTEK
ncbi:MAG: helix-turn-helix domain-containing protein [Bacteroidetes bacterium]|nr:helix-turn-helix domain-containing protein [Bacteroidota bacterium]